MTKAQDANNDSKFELNEYIVYPSHGVGKIVGIEKQEVAGLSLELYVIDFEREKMKLRVPLTKVQQVGMRKLSDSKIVDKALSVLGGRARIKRTMWSRRAQEYEMKINSGDPVAIAEVLRDLKRSNDDREQSYSERQIYQSALERLAREVAAVEKITEMKATEQLEGILGKSAKKKAA